MEGGPGAAIWSGESRAGSQRGQNHGVGRKQGRLAGFGRSGLRSSRFHTIGLKPGLFEEIRGVIWTSSYRKRWSELSSKVSR